MYKYYVLKIEYNNYRHIYNKVLSKMHLAMIFVPPCGEIFSILFIYLFIIIILPWITLFQTDANNNNNNLTIINNKTNYYCKNNNYHWIWYYR